MATANHSTAHPRGTRELDRLNAAVSGRELE